MQVRFEMFQSSTRTWEKLFAEAAAFAAEVGRERLIGISHSEGGGSVGNGVVAVWYWEADPARPPAAT